MRNFSKVSAKINEQYVLFLMIISNGAILTAIDDDAVTALQFQQKILQSKTTETTRRENVFGQKRFSGISPSLKFFAGNQSIKLFVKSFEEAFNKTYFFEK